MGPFRPPREAVDRLRLPVLPDKPDSAGKENTNLDSDSDEATELGLVYGPSIIKETQEDEPRAMVKNANIHVTSSELPSLSLSEFETYMVAREPRINTREAQSKNVELGTMNKKGDGSQSLSVPYHRPENLSNDEWWESVLQCEKDRVARFVDVNVDDILLHASSSDDDMPIVRTLQGKTFKEKAKKKTKSLWTYETVLEPTGAVSKYWDADAPSERAMKRQAKEKLSALQIASNTCAGSTTSLSPKTML